MEVLLRCAVPDRPGALASLAAAVAEAGADIESVEVVENADGRAVDDLLVVVDGPAHLRAVLDRLTAHPDVELVHAGPSRGHPGDAVTRLALLLEGLLDGAMPFERAVTTLIGGLVHARATELVDEGSSPGESSTVLVLPIAGRSVVARRDYPFSPAERQRAEALARLCSVILATRI